MSHQVSDPMSIPSSTSPNYGAISSSEVENGNYPFGVPVSLSSFDIQMEFVRKVYSIFSSQLLIIIVIAASLLYNEEGRRFVQNFPWVWWISFVIALTLLVGLTYQANDEFQPPPILVFLYTLLSGYVIGGLVALLKLFIVLDSLILLLLVSLSMIAYTYQKLYYFKSKQTIIYIFFILTVAMLILHPLIFTFVDALPALAIVSILCTFFILDTYYMMQTVSNVEFWGAAMQLHLDLVVPFRSIHHICEVSADN